jgi:hypothetical protein
MSWIKDHWTLFVLCLVFFLEGEWDDLKSLYGFMKDPKDLKIDEVDLDVYDDLGEDLWE